MKKLFSLVFIAVLSFSSCATLFKGTTEEVRFESKPNGAEIWIDGQRIGTTPASFRLESKKTYLIEFKLSGTTRTVRLTNHMAAGYLVLDLLAGLIPIIVDAATGAWFKLDSNNVIVDIDWPADSVNIPLFPYISY